ncbi:hypothetical protein [Roseateles sp.]|uniref:hypothetical protein n=1 Tax=Roseateles sp. TaxID=1971397 RepID=UPI0039E95B7B
MSAALALPRRSPPDPRLLQRCLLLAMLLHVWLVLVFGNATGTATPGQGVWGSLTVKLIGRSGGAPDAPPGDPAPLQRDNGALGSGAQPRHGGQVRPATPAATDPGAAELGRWNPREVAPQAARTDETSSAPPSTATLELPEAFKPIARENLETPVPRGIPTPAAELPATVGRLDARPDAAVHALSPPARVRAQPRPAELPALPAELPSAVGRLDDSPVPARTATLPRPAELRAAPAPAAMPATSVELPSPVRRLEATGEARTPTALPRPAELRAAPGRTTQPLPTGASLPSAVQRLEAPAAESAGVTPLRRPDELRMPAGTAAPSMPTGQDLPNPVRRLETADSAAGVAPLQPATAARALPAAPDGAVLSELSGALPGQVRAPAGPTGVARGDPSANPGADPFAAPKASAGSPDAGSRLGPDLAMPPSASASAPRAPLNLSLPRSGDIAARRGPGLVELLPQPPERKSRLEQSIENAANQDCRKAYANAGILAALPLALDAARGKGCKW